MAPDVLRKVGRIAGAARAFESIVERLSVLEQRGPIETTALRNEATRHHAAIKEALAKVESRSQRAESEFRAQLAQIEGYFDRTLDMLARAEARALRAADPLESIERQGLFVIGPARSGTTILLNALNASPEIFLFGEACFFRRGDERDFARWYNHMHQSYGNHETKSARCPVVYGEQAGWQEYVQWLGKRYELVGEKIALGPSHLGWDTEALLEFQEARFYGSRYVFTFRNPASAARSATKLVGIDDVIVFLEGIVSTIVLYLRMVRTMPRVTAISLERVDETTFEKLSDFLGVDVRGGVHYYDRGAQSSHDDVPISGPAEDLVRRTADLHERLINTFGAPNDEMLPQLEQKTMASKTGTVRPTPLGALFNEATALLADLRRVIEQRASASEPNASTGSAP